MVERSSPFFVESRQVNKFTCLPVYLSTFTRPHYNTTMPAVRFPNVMKFYVNNQSEFFVPAATIQDLVDQIVEQYPSVKFHLVDSDGQLRKHFNVFVNNVHIRDLQGMETLLKEEDKVILMASAAGG
jgi:sulfur-carrier protein